MGYVGAVTSAVSIAVSLNNPKIARYHELDILSSLNHLNPKHVPKWLKNVDLDIKHQLAIAR